MTADEIMTENVTTIDDTAPLVQAVEIMEEQEIRHLPVMRGDELVGMLSDQDLRGFGVSLVNDVETMERLQAKLRAPVSDAMSSDVIHVRPSTDVTEIVDLFVEERIHAVPVVDEATSRLMGIVSTVDVLRAMRSRVAD